MVGAATPEGDHADTACVLLGLSGTPTSSGPTARSSTPIATATPSPTLPPTAVAVVAHVPPLVGAPGPPSKSASSATLRRRSQVAALPRKEWSSQEDETIRKGVEQLGCRWRVIASQLPGRSDDAVRNRWSRLQETARAREGAIGSSSSSSAAAGSAAAASGASAGGARAHRADGKSSADGFGVAEGVGKGERTPSKSRAKAKEAKGDSTKKERSSWTRVEDDVIVQVSKLTLDYSHSISPMCVRTPFCHDTPFFVYITGMWLSLNEAPPLGGKTHPLPQPCPLSHTPQTCQDPPIAPPPQPPPSTPTPSP